MYVHIASFNVKPGDEVTFLELQKFEENQDAKPAGLVKFNIFKDRNTENGYWLLEYWETKEDKDKLEGTEMHKVFHGLRDSVLEEKPQKFECDVIV